MQRQACCRAVHKTRAVPSAGHTMWLGLQVIRRFGGLTGLSRGFGRSVHAVVACSTIPPCGCVKHVAA
eukprot:362167-Chlamydomonas_euryale.AAC.4